MTEAERAARLLVRRMQAAGFPETVLGADHEQQYLILDTKSRTGLKVFICLWVQSTGGLREALSFVFDDKATSLMGRHLNNWRRPEGEFTVPQLVESLWAKFWKHEVENRALGRLLWMYTPTLPDLDEVEHTGPDLLWAPPSKEKPQPRGKKTRAAASDEPTTTVFDLFKE